MAKSNMTASSDWHQGLFYTSDKRCVYIVRIEGDTFSAGTWVESLRLPFCLNPAILWFKLELLNLPAARHSTAFLASGLFGGRSLTNFWSF